MGREKKGKHIPVVGARPLIKIEADAWKDQKIEILSVIEIDQKNGQDTGNFLENKQSYSSFESGKRGNLRFSDIHLETADALKWLNQNRSD